ncbi:TatD family hydrolase [candidate division KSB1 bacterium]
MLIDSHSHLQFNSYDEDIEKVIHRSLKNDIKYIINIGTNYDDSVKSVRLSEKYENIYSAVGVHPHDSVKMSEAEFEKIAELLKLKKVVAVGEIGLDYYKDYSPRDVQKEVFKKFLNLAEAEKLPIIIHNRNASEDIKEIILKESKEQLFGVMHCFSGDAKFAKDLVEYGFYISFAGNITYPKFKSADVINTIPLERILVETDCPFLSPVPKRGQRNEPSNVRFVAEKIAQIKEVPFEEVKRVTSENARKLFRLN